MPAKLSWQLHLPLPRHKRSRMLARLPLLPPHPRGSSARKWPSSRLLARVALKPLVRHPPNSSSAADRRQPPSPTRRRRLRPAGQRPASRRLSRSSSAPERTINVLLRRRRGRTAVLSGAEAARLSRSTAGLPSAAIPLFWILGSLRHTAQYLSESSPGRTDPKLDLYSETETLSDYKKICSPWHVAFTCLLSERSSLRQPRPGTAPMPRMCRGPPNAAPPRAAPCQRCFVF